MRLIIVAVLLSLLSGCIPFLVGDYLVSQHEREAHDGGVSIDGGTR